MIAGFWQWLKRWPAMFTAPPFDPAERAHRIVTLQRNIILPARLVVIAVVFYMIYQSPWGVGEVGTPKYLLLKAVTYGNVFETIQNLFIVYASLIIVATVLVSVVRQFPPASVQWGVFIIGLGDGIFLAGLTILTR